MVSLTEENRIAVPTGGIEDAEYIFPSFADLAEPIRRLLKRKIVVSGADVTDRTSEERIRFFDQNVVGTEKLPVRGPEGEVVEMSSSLDWKNRIPANAKIAAASVFDEPAVSDIQAADVFGDPTTVTVDAVVGIVTFDFPPLDDPEFGKALKALMSDRLRQRGRRIQDRTFEVRQEFFRKTVLGIGNVDVAKTKFVDQVPANWVGAACRVFERQEALSAADLGN